MHTGAVRADSHHIRKREVYTIVTINGDDRQGKIDQFLFVELFERSFIDVVWHASTYPNNA